MKEALQHIKNEFEQSITQITTAEQLESVRVEYLGRNGGKLNEVLRSLKSLSPEEKKIFGPLANQTKQQIEGTLNHLSTKLSQQSQGTVKEDLTLPGIAPQQGHLHPLTHVTNELMDIFTSMGFCVYEGQELDHDFYNFEALNFPQGHSARDMHDTFFIKTPITRKEKSHISPEGPWLMRTQTSNMQIRLMEQFEPPLRCIVPGRVFRNEAIDASHESNFYQLEGFIVDENVSIGQLTWTLKKVFSQLYGKDIQLRLRPGYFPFVEPGYEVDMGCIFCNQEGCKTCKGTGWMEMLGAGMIHPNVFTAAGYPEGKYTGFAFGMGIMRLAMMKYAIPDIRLFMENDVRFLNQF